MVQLQSQPTTYPRFILTHQTAWWVAYILSGLTQSPSPLALLPCLWPANQFEVSEWIEGVLSAGTAPIHTVLERAYFHIIVSNQLDHNAMIIESHMVCQKNSFLTWEPERWFCTKQYLIISSSTRSLADTCMRYTRMPADESTFIRQAYCWNAFIKLI